MTGSGMSRACGRNRELFGHIDVPVHTSTRGPRSCSDPLVPRFFSSSHHGPRHQQPLREPCSHSHRTPGLRAAHGSYTARACGHVRL
eukprot:scaffold115694_cov71-Phaeocystis_antarctica.AAC.1